MQRNQLLQEACAEEDSDDDQVMAMQLEALESNQNQQVVVSSKAYGKKGQTE